ncbi:MAG: hypothetical protein JWR50_3561 [Mucilaginibacter sp.]|nr:hypothetical protein [Mucilaginibacter sp.]
MKFPSVLIFLGMLLMVGGYIALPTSSTVNAADSTIPLTNTPGTVPLGMPVFFGIAIILIGVVFIVAGRSKPGYRQ